MDTTYDPAWLRRRMDAAGIRTGALAKASSISRAQIQRIRNGAPPRMDTLMALQAGIAALEQAKAA
jgi:transcriptional regulator with XRE-family HTH domain